jgi:hypothetical protein
MYGSTLLILYIAFVLTATISPGATRVQIDPAVWVADAIATAACGLQDEHTNGTSLKMLYVDLHVVHPVELLQTLQLSPHGSHLSAAARKYSSLQVVQTVPLVQDLQFFGQATQVLSAARTYPSLQVVQSVAL